MTEPETIQSFEPDGEPLLVRGESGEEYVEFHHTQPRPDKTFRTISSVYVDRDALAKQHPILATRLAAEEALNSTCSRSEEKKTADLARISLDGDQAALALLKIARSRSSVHGQEVRSGAIKALSNYPSAEVADSLQDLVEDVDEVLAIRCRALLSLGVIGSPHAVRLLEKQLRVGSASLRRAAARALAHAPATSIAALEIAVREDPDARVARQAYATINAIERRVGEKLSSVRPPRAPQSRGPKRDTRADTLTRDQRRSGGRK